MRHAAAGQHAPQPRAFAEPPACRSYRWPLICALSQGGALMQLAGLQRDAQALSWSRSTGKCLKHAGFGEARRSSASSPGPDLVLPLSLLRAWLGSGPMTLVAELEAHQRPIRATSCDFTKASSAERRREPVIERHGRTVGAGVNRASIEHPCAVSAGPIDSACEKRRRDPLPAVTRLGHEAGDTPHPRVGGRSLGRRRREAPRAIPARHIGARTDLDPADGSPAPIGEQPGWRACLDARPEQLPGAGPKRCLEVAPRHAPVHAPALAAGAAPVAKHDFQIGPPGWRQRNDLDLRWTG